MAIFTGIAILLAEQSVPDRKKQRADAVRMLPADERCRVGQTEQRLSIVDPRPDDTGEHRWYAAVFDRVVAAIDLKPDIAGVDRAARRKHGSLCGLPVGALNGLAIGADHGGSHRQGAEISIGGEPGAEPIAQREARVAARTKQNFRR